MTATPPERSSIDRWLAALPYLIVLVPGVVYGFWSVFFGTTWAEKIIEFNDDAYYYFQVAWNIAGGHGSTFDGLSKTNGYHPLWMALMIGVFSIASSKLQGLVLVRVLEGLVWMGSIGLLYRIARRLDATTLFAFALPCAYFTIGMWLSGLETSAALFLLLLVALVVVQQARAPRDDLWPYVELGGALAMLMLARLDAVFFVAVFGGLRLLVGLVQRERLARLLLIPGIPILCLGLYMGVNVALFDTPMPISGQSKGLGGDLPNWSVFHAFFWQRPVRVFPFERIDYGDWYLFLFVPTFLVCLWREWRHWTAPERVPADGFRWLERFFGCLLVTNAVQLVYYALSSSWQLWPHYYYYGTIALFLAPPILIHGLAASSWKRIERPVAMALVVILTVIVVGVIRQRIAREVEPPFAGDFKRASVEVAAFLNAETEPDAVFAMGDRAGSLGFQLERPLVHTEGLVNSKAYLDALAAGRVHAFLQEKGVDYVIYSGGPTSGGDPVPVETRSGEHCSEFTEPKFGSGPKVRFVVCEEDRIFGEPLGNAGAGGGSYDVWRYRPELNRDS